EVTIYVGLYRRGVQGEGARVQVVSGPSDGKNRVKAVTLPVGAAKPKKTEPDYLIRRATGKITIDGKGDEPDWQNAPSTGQFQLAQGGGSINGATTAKLLWDDNNLYALVNVTDRDVFSEYTKHDDPIWKQDVVELFIDA